MPPQSYTTTTSIQSALPYSLYKQSAEWGDESGYLTIRNAAEGSVVSDPTLWIGQQRWTQGDPVEYKYRIWRGTCRFSVINPNITILEVKIELKLDGKQGDDFDVVVRNGMPDYPHYPAVAGDYYYGNYTVSEGSISTVGWASGESRNVIISNNAIQVSTYDEHRDLALGTYVLMSSNDVSTIAPTTYEYISLIERPKLYLQYSFDLVATTQGLIGTNVNNYNLKGTTISHPDDGWTEFGFEYYRVGDEANIQKYSEEGNIGNQHYSQWVEILIGGDYYCRTYVHSAAESCTARGDWVAFTVPGSAAITTNAASAISYLYATGNGDITGGTDITERGFEVKITFSGSLGEALAHQVAGFDGTITYSSGAWGGVLTKTETEIGTLSTGVYSLLLSDGSQNDRLFKCETYTYRAYMVDASGTTYGDYVAFDTSCDAGGDQQPTDDISDGNPTVPIIPITDPSIDYPPFPGIDYPPFPGIDYPPFPGIDYPPFPPLPPWDINLPELPPWVYWDFPDLPPLPPWFLPDLPDWEIPDYLTSTWLGDFYYKRPYTQKDLNELRKKCIIYNKNSVELALILRHNMNVLREFFNGLSDNLSDRDEFNQFKDIIPTQHLKELYLDKLDLNNFKYIINDFINNSTSNLNNINHNFNLIEEGLSDYETGSDDGCFRGISSSTKTIVENNPDVHRLKRVIDGLNKEASLNFNNIIMYNLKIIKAKLL